MELTIYRVMRETSWPGADIDGCPIMETETAVVLECLSKVEAIRQAQKIFSKTRAGWVAVFADRITDRGRIYGDRIYNKYRNYEN